MDDEELERLRQLETSGLASPDDDELPDQIPEVVDDGDGE